MAKKINTRLHTQQQSENLWGSAFQASIEKIINTSLDLICVLDAKGILLNINDASESILGYQPPELIGQPIYQFLFSEDVAETKAMAEKVISGEPVINFENRYVRKDGSIVHLSWSARYDPVDRIRYAIARDVTELKRKEAALTASEHKYRLLFETSPLPILIWEQHSGDLIDCNAQALLKYDYSKPEILQLKIIDFFSSDSRSAFEAWLEVNNMSGMLPETLWRQQKKSGVLMDVMVSGHQIDIAGKSAIFAVFNDVTESRYFRKLDLLEKNLLEINAGGEYDLKSIVHTYLSGIESLHEGMLCSMQEKRGTKLFHIAAPSLPEAFVAAIEGGEIGENAGSCGSAAYLKTKVIVSDISTDRRWAGYREAATLFGLNTCWSQPIMNTRGEVIATFACYYRAHKTPSPLEENTISRAAHILQVILENHTKKLELLASNERFEYVTEATRDVIWDWDLETDEIFYSGNFEKLFGYDSGIVRGLELFVNRVHPDDRDRVVMYADDIRHGQMVNWTAEYRFRKADGEYAFVMDKGIVIRDIQGIGTRMVGAMQDVSLQKQEQEHLKLLESVITNASDAVLITSVVPENSPDAPIVFVNDAFTRMTGYTLAEIKGKSPNILRGPKTDPEEVGKLDRLVNNWQAGEVTLLNYKKDGSEFWVHVSINPVARPDGVFTHWIGIQRDITKKKNGELEVALIAEISGLFNQYGGLAETLINVLKKLVEYGKFATAEAWLIGTEKSQINLVAKYPKTDQMQIFYEESAGVNRFVKGEGLPGTVWQTREIQYWNDIQENESFIRKEAAKKAGLKTAYGIPLQYNNEVIGVLVVGLNKEEKSVNSFTAFFESFNTHFGAEIKRKQLEEELNQLFIYAPDIICVGSADGFFKKVNPAMSRLLGYSERELLGTPYWNFVHPEDREVSLRELEQHDGISNFYVENRYITKSGKLKWLSWTVTPAPEEGLFFGVAKDITERKELEELLRKASSLARIGSWEYDLLKDAIYWSEMAKEIFGTDTGFVPDKDSSSRFFREEGLALFEQMLEEAGATGKHYDFELPVTTAGGEDIWVRVLGEPEFVNGKCVRVYGSFQDITDMKNAVSSLEASEKRYSELFHLSPLPMWVIDYESFQFLDVNIAAIAHYGYSKEEFLRRSLRDIVIDAEQQALEKAVWGRKDKKSNYVGMFNHRKKNGEVIQVDIESNLIYYNGKKAKVALVNDISERMRYIQAIEQQNKKLTEISWMQSHIIRAPLARIMGLIQLIKETAPGEEEKQTILDYVLISAGELDDVISNISDKTDIVDL